MSELEINNYCLERTISYDSITEIDLFLENCSSLYNLILDAIHDLSSKTLTCQRLEEMAAAVADAGNRLVIDNPEVEGVVALRLNTITSALEQLRLRKGPTSDSESCSSRSTGSSEIRGWIHSIERRLKQHEDAFQQRKSYSSAMTKLLADQQVLQLEIQTEGQSQINRLFNQIRSECDPSSDHYGRKKSNADAIRKKWHTLYLSSLSLQFRIEDLLNKAQEDSESESDEEFRAPPLKKARRSSASCVEEDEEEDTLPFAESEYESIMDGRATVTSISSDESPARVRKWESVQQDIGYSSGENSVHEALNSLVDSQTPIRSFINSKMHYYHTVMGDVSDAEVLSAMELKLDDNHVQNQLSESMHVNYDQNTSTVLPEYEEVMALMDEEESRVVRSESFNTSWKEIFGETPKKTVHEYPDAAKHSCDASSEEEPSDWEGTNHPDLMSRSFNSALTGGSTHSLKRHRTSTKKSSQLLDCSEMDASFCSTRSDMPPCMGRSFLRKKLRIRRMPRSMSDGEQLGVKSGILSVRPRNRQTPGILTPHIRISPPRTPLSSSTRLLQELDRQLLASESDTVPDNDLGDMPAYEWDDYKPPEKDDSMPDELSLSQPRSTEDLLVGDDDFGQHFSSTEHSRRLLEESRAHLKVLEKFIENDDVDAHQEDIELICQTNLRHMDSVIKMSVHSDTTAFRELRQQWSRLLSSVTNPATKMLRTIGRFSKSLRDLHSSTASGVLNSMAEIKSKEDAYAALEAITAIHNRLSGERDELRIFLQSDKFQQELPEISDECVTISESYDEAVYKIDSLVQTLKKVYGEWSSLHAMQKDIRHSMASIEDRLKTTNFDQSAVLDQMEFCQERMNSLETMCNYLTSTLSSVQNGDTKVAPDFKAEISLYANALRQLRSRFNELIRVPTPPTPSAVPSLPVTPIATSTPHKAIKRVRARQTQTRAESSSPATRHSPGSRIYRAISSSWWIKGLLALSLATAVAALFFTTLYGATFGPHLTYVRGPPPI